MIQLVEMEGKMNENGCIEVPAVVLEQTGIRTGETVKLIYMAEEESLENEAKEFLLVRAGQDVAGKLAKEEEIAFQIPQELLRMRGYRWMQTLILCVRNRKSSSCLQSRRRRWSCRKNCLHCAVNLAFPRTK